MVAKDHLQQGQLLFEQGDFREATKENQRVLSLIETRDPVDRALFNLGLIYAHQDNPERDYERSVEYFKRLLEEYPDSPLYNNAKAWFFLLNENMEAKTKIENLSRINGYLLQNDELIKINDFKKALDVNQKALSISGNEHRLDEVLFNIGLIYSHHNNPDKDYNLSIKYFEKLIKEYPESPLLDQEQTDELIKVNDFKKALDVNKKALSISGNGHRLDEVLFNIGFIYAHHDNPDKNYKQSIKYFERLIKEHPESPLVDQAKVWQGLLDVIEKSKQVDIEIDQKKKELAR
jgi:tetratricopeptide (TPR) repeat protein